MGLRQQAKCDCDEVLTQWMHFIISSHQMLTATVLFNAIQIDPKHH